MGAVLFGVVAGLAVAGGVGVIASRRPVYSALALLLVLGALAVDYFILDAPFIAALQIIIYAGAIVVLFVFIIMLLHVESGEEPRMPQVLPAAAGVLGGAVFGLAILAVVTRAPGSAAPVGVRFGTVQEIGRALFGPYLFPFEAASIVLLIGMIGAVAQGRRLAGEGAGAAAVRSGGGPRDGGDDRVGPAGEGR